MFSDNLFRFGNKDGQGADARLQHPLAVCTLSDASILVADSYNHQLKVNSETSRMWGKCSLTGLHNATVCCFATLHKPNQQAQLLHLIHDNCLEALVQVTPCKGDNVYMNKSVPSY